MKRRHRVDDPTRVVMEKQMDEARAAAAGGTMISVWFVGFTPSRGPGWAWSASPSRSSTTPA